jgi:hypothetical protein
MAEIKEKKSYPYSIHSKGRIWETYFVDRVLKRKRQVPGFFYSSLDMNDSALLFPFAKLIGDFEALRGFTLRLVTNINENQARFLPVGSKNNLHWQLGHLLYVQSLCLFTWSGRPALFGHGFADYFGIGTDASHADSLAPDWDELMALAKRHSRGMLETVGPRLAEPLVKPYRLMNLKMSTTGDTVPFMLAHEGEHIGHIKRLVKAASV